MHLRVLPGCLSLTLTLALALSGCSSSVNPPPPSATGTPAAEPPAVIPPAPPTDQDLVLALHLDGDASDSSGCGNNGSAVGEVAWVEGKQGKALALQGKGGVLIPGSQSLTIADQSWTLEAWIKPSTNQPTHSPVLSTGFGNSIGYGLRISYLQNLYGQFEAGPGKAGNAGSGDVAATLFDGNWHQVALVLDREHGGQVRVYLDGADVTANSTPQPLPLHLNSQATEVAVGLVNSWSLGSGYVGLIDEIRISRGVCEPWRSRLPPDVKPPAPVATLKADIRPPAVTLQPAATVILKPAFTTAVDEQACLLLQQSLRKVYRSAEGFDILAEGTELAADRFVLAVGPGNWAPKATLEKLAGRDFILIRSGNRVVMTGGEPGGTMRAVTRFLDRFCGIRFYMPTDLFTSLPATREITLGAIDLSDSPRIRDVVMGMFWNMPEENDWVLRNGVGLQASYLISHSMLQRFPPARFAKRLPEIYPILKGERHIPADQDHEWQPCFSEPKLVEAAEEEALEWFRRNPRIRGITYAVQDSHAFCECPRCLALIQKAGDKTQAYSDMFWTFLNQLAARLEKRLPEYGIPANKVIIGMAYSEVRNPPPFKLHPAIMAYPVFTVADLLIDKILEDGPNGIRRWNNAASQIGQYDWAQGDGYFIPRLYAGLATRLFDRQHRFTLAKAETYPNWGLDGPKYWMLVQIWDNPGSDSHRLYEQFCSDMFGPAKDEMLAYFLGLEELWISMDADAERKLFKWKTQFILRPPQIDMVRAARAHLDKATTLARTPEEKQRVELFSKTFKLSELLFAIANAPTIRKSQIEELRTYTATVIAPDPMTLNSKGQGQAGPLSYIQNQLESILIILTEGKTIE